MSTGGDLSIQSLTQNLIQNLSPSLATEPIPDHRTGLLVMVVDKRRWRKWGQMRSSWERKISWSCWGQIRIKVCFRPSLKKPYLVHHTEKPILMVKHGGGSTMMLHPQHNTTQTGLAAVTYIGHHWLFFLSQIKKKNAGFLYWDLQHTCNILMGCKTWFVNHGKWPERLQSIKLYQVLLDSEYFTLQSFIPWW